MNAHGQKDAPGGIPFVGQQELLADAVEFVDMYAGEIASLRFTDFRMGDDGGNGFIDPVFLVVMLFLVILAEAGGLQDRDGITHDPAPA